MPGSQCHFYGVSVLRSIQVKKVHFSWIWGLWKIPKENMEQQIQFKLHTNAVLTNSRSVHTL